MTFFSLGSRRLEVVGAEQARERETISGVVYKASCWDWQEFYIGKTIRRFSDRKNGAPQSITSNNHSPAIAPRGGGEYYWEFLVGVCRQVLQILTLFLTKKCKFHTRFLAWPLGRNYVIITKL